MLVDDALNRGQADARPFEFFAPVQQLLAESDPYQVGFDAERLMDRARQVFDTCIWSGRSN